METKTEKKEVRLRLQPIIGILAKEGYRMEHVKGRAYWLFPPHLGVRIPYPIVLYRILDVDQKGVKSHGRGQSYLSYRVHGSPLPCEMAIPDSEQAMKIFLNEYFIPDIAGKTIIVGGEKNAVSDTISSIHIVKGEDLVKNPKSLSVFYSRNPEINLKEINNFEFAFTDSKKTILNTTSLSSLLQKFFA